MIHVENLPPTYTDKLLKAYFQTYGPVQEAKVTGQAAGYVTFKNNEDVALVTSDSVEIGGNAIKVTAGEQQMKETLALADGRPLDMAIVRGECNKTSIALVANYAKNLSTVLVVWEHATTEDSVKAGVRTESYDLGSSMAEEKYDNFVRDKAGEVLMANMPQAPKVGLFHMVSDKLPSEEKFEDGAFQHIDELLHITGGTNYETMKALKAITVYQPWIAPFGGCNFFVFPPSLEWWQSTDVCKSNCALHWMVMIDPMKHLGGAHLPDGVGCTYGFQLTGNDVSKNSNQVFRTANQFMGTPNHVRQSFAGKLYKMEA